VFELHIIKDFFYWLYSEPGQYVDCRTMKKIFDSPDSVNIPNAMMKRLAWYDDREPVNNGFPSELFVLEAGLNLMKGAVSCIIVVL
jgi:hypothetical protein